MISVSERTLITAHGTCFSAGIEEEQGTSVKSTHARKRAGRACAKYHALVQTYTRKIRQDRDCRCSQGGESFTLGSGGRALAGNASDKKSGKRDN